MLNKELTQSLKTREISKLAKMANMLAIGHGEPEHSEEWALAQLETYTGEQVYWGWICGAAGRLNVDLEDLGYSELPEDLLDADPEDVEAEIRQSGNISQNDLDAALVAEILEQTPAVQPGSKLRKGEFDDIRDAAKTLANDLYAEKNARLADSTPDEYHRIAGKIHPYFSGEKLHGAAVESGAIPTSTPVIDLDLGDYTSKLDADDVERLCETLISLLPEKACDYVIDPAFIFESYDAFQNWLTVRQQDDFVEEI